MSRDLKEKYDIIYGYEQQFAFRLAQEVLKKPETSVWMILIPVLFIHHVTKIKEYKANVRSFAKNILSTRQKALDKAYREAEAGKSISYAVEDYFPDVTLVSKKDKILAEKQIRVIRAMEEHYLGMLKIPGKTLEELIRGVYRDSREYRRYLDRLTEAEMEVSRYLMEHFHVTEEARAVARNIECRCEELRELEVKFFF